MVFRPQQAEEFENVAVTGHLNREFKQLRRRRRGRRVVKNEFIIYKQNSRLLRSARFPNGSKNVFKLNMQSRRSIPNGNTKNQPSSSTFRRQRKTWSFHVVVIQRTAKKCTKNYNAHAQLLFCSLNLQFGALHVAVVVVVCLSSLDTLTTNIFKLKIFIKIHQYSPIHHENLLIIPCDFFAVHAMSLTAKYYLYSVKISPLINQGYFRSIN